MDRLLHAHQCISITLVDSDKDSHLRALKAVLFLQQFDASQSLLLHGLIGLHDEVDFADGMFDALLVEGASTDRVNTFLLDELHDTQIDLVDGHIPLLLPQL
jgi:hypothetical protein